MKDEIKKPVAWMRRWKFDGETPKKEKNINGCMVWHVKFTFRPVTEHKVFIDDVPLYLE